MTLQLDTTTLPGRTIVYNETVSVAVETTVDGNSTTTITTTTTTPTAICIDYSSSILALTSNVAIIAKSAQIMANSLINIEANTAIIANSLVGINSNTGIISIEANNNIIKLATLNATLHADSANVVDMMVNIISSNLYSMSVHQEHIDLLASTTGFRITEPWGWLSMSSVARLAETEGTDLTAVYDDMKNITEF
jgi:hypothetical protein